ncbi:MAG: sigma 54-interacting transcriptional regulator [Myxococcota bacterium]|nr:sigma 54-interacting transcriptional regulator [Myxococcota bacterium]MDW8362024.1 sigma 54-interacting transcriptional regulator [Myxococcales bacterium]
MNDVLAQEWSCAQPVASCLRQCDPIGPDTPASVRLRRAVLEALAGRYDRAAEALAGLPDTAASRSDAARVRAFVCLEAGEAHRALMALADVEDDASAAVLVAAGHLELGRLDEARRRLEGVDGADPMAGLLRARLWIEQGAPLRAIEVLEERTATGWLEGQRARLRAEARLALGDAPNVERAHAELGHAIWCLLRLGTPAELGRAYVAMARLVRARGGSAEQAAQWLARAHRVFQHAGTDVDRARLRQAFRACGRRLVDRLVDEPLGAALDAVRLGHARARSLTHELQACPNLPTLAAESLAELEGLVREATEQCERAFGALEGLLVERQRLVRLTDVCRQLLEVDEVDQLAQRLPHVVVSLGHESAAVLDADGRVVAHAGRWEGVDSSDESALRRAQQGTRPVVEVARGRRHIVVSLHGGSRPRYLAVRDAWPRRPALGVDDEYVGVLASVASAVFERLEAEATVREAAARDATTLAVIRDGIVRVDEQGLVRGLNDAALGLLHVRREQIENRRLGELPALGALAQALERDGGETTVRLGTTEVLVRVRRMRDGGFVATLQELGHARQAAQRLVGSEARFTFADFVGRSPALVRVLEDARRLAATDVQVLITGESGVGKELLAQAIHNASPRAGEPFVGVNVAALPRELIESELFGYEAGAFTGARSRGHPGRFELAGAGTLLLDEIGDLPLDMQAKLLRVLQERTFQRLGGSRPLRVQARIIATTHRDLEAAVRDGMFRLDLYYRLRVAHLHLPPLRERAGDVPVLVEHVLRRFASRTGRAPLRVAPDLMARLERYAWPGNVRELVNLLEGMASLLPDGVDELAEVPAPLRRDGEGADVTGVMRRVVDTASGAQPTPAEPVEPLAVVERRALLGALRATGGNVARAAQLLGVARNTLYAMIDRHGLREHVRRRDAPFPPGSGSMRRAR